MKKQSGPIIVLLLALTAVVAAANDDADFLEDDELLAEEALTFGDDYVSIATGSEQSLSRAPAVATVITAQDIEAMGASNLDQVLETVPGLHVSNSSLRSSSIYLIRGIYTDHNPQVLMLVNGVPITQLYQGDRGWHLNLPVSDIARLEVIRGPGSAVYGADAFAGVINVITKKSQDISGTEIRGEVGSFGTAQTSLLHGGEYGGFDLSFYIDYFKVDGDDSRIIESDAQSVFDSAFGSNASFAPGPMDTREEKLDIRLELEKNFWHFRAWNWRRKDMGLGAGLAQAIDQKGGADIDNYLIDLTYHNPNISQYLDFKSVLSYMDINFESEQKLFPPGTILPIGSDGNINPIEPVGLVSFPDGFIGNPSFFENHARLDLSLFYTGMENHRFRLGAGIAKAKLSAKEAKNFGPGVIDGTLPTVDGILTDVTNTTNIYIEDHNRTLYYISLQDEWYFTKDWDITAGVRFDNYSDFGSTVNPRAALVWHPEYNLTTKLLYGRAFRAPAFDELFVQNNPVIRGNSELAPETIDSFELAFDYQPTFDIRTTLNLFKYEIDDLIEFVSTGGTVLKADNVGQREGYGLEWEVDWHVMRVLDMKANYSFQKSEDLRNGTNVGHAPTHQVYIQADWRFLPRWSLNSQVNWVGSRKRVAGDPRSEIDDYTIVDLMISRNELLENWDFAFIVRNLFDDNAREPSPAEPAAPEGSFVPGDYPLPERGFYAKIKYRL